MEKQDQQILKTKQMHDKQVAYLREQIAKQKELADVVKTSGDDQIKLGQGFANTGRAMIAGMTGVLTVLNQVSVASQKLLEEAHQIAKVYEESFRPFQLQGGVSNEDMGPMRESIVNIAHKMAVPVPRAAAAASQLVSSGFEPEEASAGGLEAFLSVLKATGHAGQEYDMAELALSMSQYMVANNMPRTGENIIDVGKRIQTLAATNFQLNHLTALAKEAGSFRNYMNVEDQLATASYLVESFDPSMAATAMRNMTVRLASAGGDKRRVESLRMMGLKPQDVDFIDEDWFTILDRLAEGMEKVPQNKRATVMKRLFEEANIAPAQFLIDGRNTARGFAELQRDSSGFSQALEVGTSGVNAAAIRQQISLDEYKLSQNQNDELIAEEMDAILREQGYAPWQISMYRSAFNKGLSIGNFPVLPSFRGLGMSQETAANLAYGGPSRGDVYGAARERAEERMQGVTEETGQQIVKELQQLNQKVSNDNRQPPRQPTSTILNRKK